MPCGEGVRPLCMWGGNFRVMATAMRVTVGGWKPEWRLLTVAQRSVFVPIAPFASHFTLCVCALGSDLAVVMIVTPEPVFMTIDIIAFRRNRTARMKRLEKPMSDPSRPVS